MKIFNQQSVSIYSQYVTTTLIDICKKSYINEHKGNQLESYAPLFAVHRLYIHVIYFLLLSM